jgi:hypothetical protein
MKLRWFDDGRTNETNHAGRFDPGSRQCRELPICGPYLGMLRSSGLPRWLVLDWSTRPITVRGIPAWTPAVCW